MFAIAMVVAGRPHLAALRLSQGCPTRFSASGKLCRRLIHRLLCAVRDNHHPRLGAASFIAFILIAQLLTSAVVDQFGLFSMARRPIDMTKLIGLTVIVLGILIMEIDNLRKAHS